ncbi:MAG: phosphoribosylamine--glycine ligase [Proteobacteria bacterium]|nr:phosphoribosylamine--glycine ligase [Pseudomonadota bacterium]
MRTIVIGSGGREHALAWKLSQSPEVSSVLCAPGNAGTAAITQSVEVSVGDNEAIVACARAHAADLVVVGPEAPLVNGVTDALAAAGIRAFGPSRRAARLEGSKIFAKRFMTRHAIPTADWAAFSDPQQAEAHLQRRQQPPVVKADGLAAGKGVVVPATHAEALQAIDQMMRGRRFGEAGARVVLEERLTGQEVSYHVVADGKHYVPLAAAQDHKRLLDADRGPNTGGMGAYSPPPLVTPELERKILQRIVEPTLAGMASEDMPYRGALFLGLMIVEGEPLVLEYNVRFGDPETQVLMSRWHGDILPLLDGAVRGELAGFAAAWGAPASVCVVLASAGYPFSQAASVPIAGVEHAAGGAGVEVFHAATRSERGQLVTAGGRVLGVTARGPGVTEAATRAYAAADCIEFEGKQYRSDIGWGARLAQ